MKKKKEKSSFFDSLSTALLIWKYGVHKTILCPTTAMRGCLGTGENRANVFNTFLKHSPSFLPFSTQRICSSFHHVMNNNKQFHHYGDLIHSS